MKNKKILKLILLIIITVLFIFLFSYLSGTDRAVIVSLRSLVRMFL